MAKTLNASESIAAQMWSFNAAAALPEAISFRSCDRQGSFAPFLQLFLGQFDEVVRLVAAVPNRRVLVVRRIRPPQNGLRVQQRLQDFVFELEKRRRKGGVLRGVSDDHRQMLTHMLHAQILEWRPAFKWQVLCQVARQYLQSGGFNGLMTRSTPGARSAVVVLLRRLAASTRPWVISDGKSEA
jgi:hypothetical protein